MKHLIVFVIINRIFSILEKFHHYDDEWNFCREDFQHPPTCYYCCCCSGCCHPFNFSFIHMEQTKQQWWWRYYGKIRLKFKWKTKQQIYIFSQTTMNEWEKRKLLKFERVKDTRNSIEVENITGNYYYSTQMIIVLFRHDDNAGKWCDSQYDSIKQYFLPEQNLYKKHTWPFYNHNNNNDEHSTHIFCSQNKNSEQRNKCLCRFLVMTHIERQIIYDVIGDCEIQCFVVNKKNINFVFCDSGDMLLSFMKIFLLVFQRMTNR